MSNKNLKCDDCNEYMDFHIHDCGKTISMYYGCKKCEDYCSKCKDKKLKKKGNSND